VLTAAQTQQKYCHSREAGIQNNLKVKEITAGIDNSACEDIADEIETVLPLPPGVRAFAE
jgi:hypothetical protein